MKYTLSAVLTVAVGLLMITGTVFAHHGRSNYDSDNPIDLKGAVTEVEWVNPHIQIHVDAKDDKGNVQNWVAEGNSPNTLARQGWNRNTVKVGDLVTIHGGRRKDGAPYMIFNKITLPNGKAMTAQIVN